MTAVDSTSRHLRLLTETIAAVNSSLDLQEVLELVARNVADALGTDACFVYLYDERANELVLRATHGSRVEEMTRTPRMRPGEGITGVAAAERAPVMIPAQAHLDPRFKLSPNLPEDEYESILAVPILAREKLEGALNVRTREPREFTEAEIELLVAIASQVAQTIEHAQLYAGANAAWRSWRPSRASLRPCPSRSTSRSRWRRSSRRRWSRCTRSGAALVLEDGKIAWPEGRPGAYAERLPLRWKRRQIGELVCDRDTPFSDDDRALLEAIAHHAAVALEHGRAVMRGVLAQEIHHRVKNNLQSVASLLRVQARAENVDPRKALQDSVNRILAIAAVHEVLTEHREDDVDLGELVDRLRAMLVQGLVAGKEVTAELEPISLAGQQATALALVFTELFQNALEHGGSRVAIGLAQRNGEVALTISDDGDGIEGDRSGTGLSIVRALVRDELRGELELRNELGLRAEVVFPRDSRARRRGRDDHPARPSWAARGRRLRGLCGGARRRGGRRARPRDAAGRRAPRREDAAARRDRGGAPDPRRAADPDRDGDGVRRAELVARAVEAGVFGYLVKPFRETDLLPAIETARARHEELSALREEAESLAEALAARKAIERAKGILMEREGLTEQEAFARLRKASQISGRPLKVVAEALVATLGGDEASSTGGVRL